MDFRRIVAILPAVRRALFCWMAESDERPAIAMNPLSVVTHKRLAIPQCTTQDETQPVDSVGSPFGLRLIKLEFGWREARRINEGKPGIAPHSQVGTVKGSSPDGLRELHEDPILWPPESRRGPASYAHPRSEPVPLG